MNICDITAEYLDISIEYIFIYVSFTVSQI